MKRDETDDEREQRQQTEKRAMIIQALRTWSPAALGSALSDEERERLTAREAVTT